MNKKDDRIITEKFEYKPVNERTDEELLAYKSTLDQLVAIDEAFYGPWSGYHLYELGQVEKELKRRNIKY